MLAQQRDWLILLLVLPALSWSAPDGPHQARRWLDRITEANQRQSYQGTFVYRFDQQMTAMQLVHVGGSHAPREKLVALNGAEHVIVQDGRSISARASAAGPRLWEREHPPVGLVTRSGEVGSAIDNFYGVELRGKDRIAGRLVDRVKLVPNDNMRNGFYLWVDQETGVVLRSDMLDSSDQVMEQIMFTHIEYLSSKAATQMVDGPNTADPSSSLAAPGMSQSSLVASDMPTPWRIGSMPPGFAIAERYIRPATATSVAQEQWVLSDGLASVSVFFEPQGTPPSKPPLKGAVRRGALNALGNNVAGHQVIVMGEVPMATVTLISESLQFSPLKQ